MQKTTGSPGTMIVSVGSSFLFSPQGDQVQQGEHAWRAPSMFLFKLLALVIGQL
jgi:hypothetical protein